MNNQALSKATANPIAMLKQEVTKLLPEFKNALPEGVSPDRFLRIVLNAVLSEPKFLLCDRKSLFQASLKCAADGLFPDSREAVLIPYGKIVQYQPMIGGVYKKVRNSGEIPVLCADIIYPSDHFEYGTNSERGRYLDHKPKLFAVDRKVESAIAAFAFARLKDGNIDFEVMPREEIEFVRSKSKSPNSPAWKEWWGEMAKKTVVKRLAKRLPMSADIQEFFDRDNEEYDLDDSEKQVKDVQSESSDLGELLGGDEPQQQSAEDTAEFEAAVAETPDPRQMK